jgi:hypothetical protein
MSTGQEDARQRAQPAAEPYVKEYEESTTDVTPTVL